MWEDFLCDPVLAARVIMGYTLDAFQAARLRYYWWVLNVIDSSGFSSGKTIVDWIWANLRCVLIPERQVGVYYPVFETGKNSFWRYYRDCSASIFRAQIGRTDEMGEDGGAGRTEGSACFKAYFRNGSTLFMPAPSFMRAAATQASMRFNDIIVEEWTHIDASSTGIDDQLIGRVTHPTWNQHHPVWGNHFVFSAPAKSQRHPSYRRFRQHQKRVESGDPSYACLGYSYKDYSTLRAHTGKTFQEEYRIESTIAARRNVSPGDWLGEGLGIWASTGTGWFSEDALAACREAASRRGLLACTSRAQL